MLRGITIMLVPLIGLGCDQVNKSASNYNTVSRHITSMRNKGEDFRLSVVD